MNEIVAMVERDGDLTLHEIASKLAISLPEKPRISTLTVHRILDGMLFTYKQAQIVPIREEL